MSFPTNDDVRTNAAVSQAAPDAGTNPAQSSTPTSPMAAPTAPLATAQGGSAAQSTTSAQGVSAQQPNAQQQVSNPTPSTSQAQPDYTSHPAVKRAGLLRSVAETLAGGPRHIIDDNGNRQPVPLSKSQIGMAIALEAISGSFAGLQAGRGRGAGAAGMAGLTQGAQQAQQEREREQQQADTRTKALTRNAQIAEVNARTILNTAEAESRGAETIQKLADTNKQVIDDYEEAGVLHGRQVTQQELQDGIKSGKFSTMDMLGPIDGYRLIGNGRVEATHA